MQLPETQKPRVLIIDDEEQIRSLLIDVLGNLYECSDAASAEQALTALSRETFDLVISDIDMGAMSGLELVPRVHSLSPDTVVVRVHLYTLRRRVHAGTSGHMNRRCR